MRIRMDLKVTIKPWLPLSSVCCLGLRTFGCHWQVDSKFTKLTLTNAYQQLVFQNNARKHVISAIMACRLPIFQRKMDSLCWA